MAVRIPAVSLDEIAVYHNVVPSSELRHLMQVMYEKGFNRGVMKVTFRAKTEHLVYTTEEPKTEEPKTEEGVMK